MDEDRILVNLLVRRQYRNMSPVMQTCYLALREAFRIAITCAVGWYLFRSVPTGIAAGLTLGTIWLLVGPWITREGPGTSRILLTDDGIHMIDDGLFCPWEDVASHRQEGDVIVFEPREGVLPPRLFRPRYRRLPLGRASREQILELFETRAGKEA